MVRSVGDRPPDHADEPTVVLAYLHQIAQSLANRDRWIVFCEHGSFKPTSCVGLVCVYQLGEVPGPDLAVVVHIRSRQHHHPTHVPPVRVGGQLGHALRFQLP